MSFFCVLRDSSFALPLLYDAHVREVAAGSAHSPPSQQSCVGDPNRRVLVPLGGQKKDTLSDVFLVSSQGLEPWTH